MMTIRLCVGYLWQRACCLFGNHATAYALYSRRWPNGGSVAYLCSVCDKALDTFHW